MKRNLIISLLLLLAMSTVSYAVSISDPANPHNMSNTSAGVKAAPTLSGGTDQICVFCHTPHSAAPQTPLWNRPDPTTATFPVYGQPLEINRDAAAIALTGYDSGSSDYPNGTSRMCLSCHDGATSIGVVLNGAPITMESGSETITNVAAIIDLASSHPISFKYDNAVWSTLLEPNKTGEYQLPFNPLIDTPLDAAERMQCTTCHDPHEDTSGDASYDSLPFWRHQGNAASYDEVCNNCHIAAPISGSLPHTLP
jgi:cytochrome c553